MLNLSRRGFATAALAAPLAAVTTTATAATSVAAPPPVARLKIGRFTVTVLTDGYVDLGYGAFRGIDPATLQATAQAQHADRGEGVRIGFSVWLVDDGERLVLIDTGPGAGIETAGRLESALASVGVAPEDIDAVAITHMHFDHISGLIAGGRRVFPNAEVFIDRRDVAYFTDAANAAAAPDLPQSSFAASADVLRLYPDLQRIDGEREIMRGLSSVDLSGHTPGHTGWRIADGDAALTITGDMMFHPTVHPSRPDVGVAFEPNADKAVWPRHLPLKHFFKRSVWSSGGW